MQNKKRTLAEDLRLIFKGYRFLSGVMGKAFYIFWALSLLVTIAIPYVDVYFAAQIVNELAGSKDKDSVLMYVYLILGCTLGLNLIAILLHTIYLSLETEDWTRIMFHFSRKSLTMDFQDIESDRVKKLYTAITESHLGQGWGTIKLHLSFKTLLSEICRIICSLTLAVSLFVLPVPQENSEFLFLNSPLTVLAMILLFALITWLLSKISVKAAAIWKQASDEKLPFVDRILSFYVHDLPSNNHRLCDTRMYGQDKFIPDANQISKDTMATIWTSGAYKRCRCLGLSEIMLQFFTGFIYVFVCLKALGGAFGIGNIAQYVAAVTGLSTGIRGLITLIGELRLNNSFIEDAFEYMEYPNNMYQGTIPVEKRNDREYTMEFRNVSFKYPGTEIYALRNVNLKFKIGQRLAVVGMNGSGKTTFIKLMCRLYDPTEGQILMNGIDIRKYDYKEYQNIFSIVFQDFKIFSFTLGQNVAASMEYDKERVEKCLIEAGFGDRLAAMPHGVDTYMYRDFEKDGVQISGGEAQKIALARALYKNAPFIILDEPTAALDPIAEFEIYSKFNEIVEDKTAIYISHRLSSCRFCDNIAVFDQGRIVQMGTHEELVADANGKYYELWHAQAQYYTETA